MNRPEWIRFKEMDPEWQARDELARQKSRAKDATKRRYTRSERYLRRMAANKRRKYRDDPVYREQQKARCREYGRRLRATRRSAR
ncbi:MAG TPA: hypothetical protein VGU43_04610 [Thermoplasmata archaeon]|nr:hypothetical protein [Thermoplasmata archaeon]